MPEPLSLDLQERIVKARTQGGRTSDEVAELFLVGRATVNRLVKRYREKGSVDPDPHGGGREKRLTASEEDALTLLVADRADATVPELVSSLATRVSEHVSTSTLSRSLARHGFTRKIWSLVATERTEERIQALRARFRAWTGALDPRRLVFLDEAGTHISLTRDYARAPSGVRAQGYVPRNRGVVTTMLGALGLDGVRALMTVGEAPTPTSSRPSSSRYSCLPSSRATSSSSTTSARTSRPPSFSTSKTPAPRCPSCRLSRPT